MFLIHDTRCEHAATGAERETALAEFYEQWKDDSLVMLKWLALQVGLHTCPAHMGLQPWRHADPAPLASCERSTTALHALRRPAPMWRAT